MRRWRSLRRAPFQLRSQGVSKDGGEQWGDSIADLLVLRASWPLKAHVAWEGLQQGRFEDGETTRTRERPLPRDTARRQVAMVFGNELQIIEEVRLVAASGSQNRRGG